MGFSVRAETQRRQRLKDVFLPITPRALLNQEMLMGELVQRRDLIRSRLLIVEPCAAGGRKGTEARSRRSCRIVEDDADRVTHAGANATDAVAKIDAISASRAFDRPVVNGEGHGIALS